MAIWIIEVLDNGGSHNRGLTVVDTLLCPKFIAYNQLTLYCVPNLLFMTLDILLCPKIYCL